MWSQKTGRACGTSGSRELCGSGARDERTARLQAAEDGTIELSISSTENGAGHELAGATEGTGGQAHAVRVSATDGDVGTGRDGSQSQAGVSPVSGRTIDDEDPAAAADPLGWASKQAGGESAEREVVDGLRE